ncbi:MAG: hypothetical protein V2G48_07960 [bacterium JZ-2024 1]
MKRSTGGSTPKYRRKRFLITQSKNRNANFLIFPKISHKVVDAAILIKKWKSKEKRKSKRCSPVNNPKMKGFIKIKKKGKRREYITKASVTDWISATKKFLNSYSFILKI